MKKVLMILALAGSISNLCAQTSNEKMEQYDNKKTTKKNNDLARAALALNSAAITGKPSSNRILGGQIGIEIQVINFSEYVGLGLGVNYSMQGGKYKSSEYMTGGGSYGSSSATTRLNYLNIPILVRFQKQREGFFAEAGLQPGLLLSAKNEGEDIKDDVKKFDVGVPLGAGYNFKNKFGAGLRVTPGLMNLNKEGETKNRNLVISLRASYAL